MRRIIHFSFFGFVLVATVVSLAQNPPVPSAPQGQPAAPSEFPPAQDLPETAGGNTPPAPTNAVPPTQQTQPSAPPQSNVQPPAGAAPNSQINGAKKTAPPPPPEASEGPQIPDSEMPVFQNPEGYHYDPTGRRDPFKPYGESQTALAPETPEAPSAPPEPLQGFDISQFRLLGIIWQVKDPKAMVLDPTGRTHLIRKQTKIGRNNGFVAAIREGEVIVVEPSVGENGVQTAVTRILNLK